MHLQLADSHLSTIREYCRSNLESFANECIKVCEVPAPGFAEMTRAEYVKTRLRDLGWGATIDETGNVVALSTGKPDKPSIMFAAHLDTVFPEGTNVSVTRCRDRLAAPGIRDNSAGVAALIVLAKALADIPIDDRGDVYLVGTVGEEGLGDLRGMKAAYQRLKDRVDYFIAVDGELGSIVHGGIASRRLKVRCLTGGGHSWANFGVPSAIHSLGRIIAKIDEIVVPKSPRTSYNVGVIEGGTSVNSIAAEASMLIDMRSIDAINLAKLEKEIRSIISEVAEKQRVNTKIEVVGDRPGGLLSSDHELVQIADSILDYLGIRKRLGSSSTDANVPLSYGRPAICVGVTTGRNGHRLDELMYISPLALGLEQLVLLIAVINCGEISA